ncbi:MAG: CusA/CzcA family heavy metal efflux RND transporter [Candidatus Obscuribacterales bacterium]|nr:CusA/CzcA family heavy metal efflux RND transporter [Candidatus Obscuribacterales bacterium]
MLNRIIKWSIKNPWIVTVLSLIWLAAGVQSALKLPIDVFPDFSPVQVVILTEAPGFAPEETESLVTRPLESGLNGTVGVKTVRSLSTTGLSAITVIFQDGTNIFTARQLVSEKLQSTRNNLPANVREPSLAPITSATGDILKIGLYANGKTSTMDLRTLADWTLRLRLMAVPGVSNVIVIGGETKQYQVLIDPEKLKQYDITLSQAVEAAAGSNINAPGGTLRTKESEELIRGLGRITSIEDLADTVITSRDGLPVLLKNVASIQIGPQFKVGDAIVDGHAGVVLTVYKQPWANTLETSRLVEKTVSELQASFPSDIKLIYTFRQADFIEVAIKNVGEALILGAVLVALVLLLFLRNWRTAFISLTAIPLSLLSAALVLKYCGYTINVMTLGGLAIAIGEVVDDAIVDVENVYQKLRENKMLSLNKNAWQVIYEASTAVRSSVVYATFIIGLVFLPVLSLGGLEGRIFSPLAAAYLAALLSSLLVALTLTPALCFLLLGSAKNLPEQEAPLVLAIKKIYTPLLRLSISNPKSVLAATILLFIFSLLPLVVMGSEFLPAFDENNLVVVATSMPGTSLTTTTNIGKELTAHFLAKHDVLATSQRAGRAEGGEDWGGGNFSEFDIRLKPDSPHKKDILYHLRHEFAHIPGLVADSGSYLQHRMEHVLSGVNAAIAIKLFGPDLNLLHKKAKEIEAVAKGIKGAVDVHVEPIIPVPQISIKIDRTAAARYGVRVKDLSSAIEAAFKGVTVSQIIEGQNSFDVYVWFKPEYRSNMELIQATLIDTPSHAKIPIGALADVTPGESPNTINHENASRRVVVQANVSGRDLGSVVQEMREAIKSKVKLPPGYYLAYSGQFEAQETATRDLIWLSAMAIIGMLLLLTFAFKSLKTAFLVMFNLPLALVGGIWAVLFSGAVLSIGSLVGFITLLGISTRNALMLVNHFNQSTPTNLSRKKRIEESALNRLSPVLMTALTASLGVLPIAVMGGAGRELEQPLAIVILGGMLSSTCLTLLVIPALLMLFGQDSGPQHPNTEQ